MRRLTRLLSVMCALSLLCLPSGCADEGLPDGSVSVYYLTDWATNDETDQVLAARAFAPGAGDDTITFCLEKLFLSPSPDEGLVSPFPPGTAQLDPYTLQDGLLTLYLSKEYAALEGLGLTMAEACLATTLCALPDVSAVKVVVDGETHHAQDKSRFTAADFSSDALVLKPVEKSLTLYFVDADDRALVSEVRLVTIRESEPAERYALEELLGGPKSVELSTALPGGDLLLGVVTENNICYVNFSASFYETPPPFTHALAIQAVTRSLTSLDGVDAVQFMIEGQVAEYYGDMRLDQPMD